MRHRIFLALLWLSVSPSAFAVDARTPTKVARLGQVTIEIPPGFSGPQRKRPNTQAELNMYVEMVVDSRPPTVIQLTHVTVPDADPNLSEQDRYLAASDFLDGFLTTFSQNVTRWTRTPNEEFRFDGYLGVRAKWSGILNGVSCTGVMYFLVLGVDSFNFHAFGSTEPNTSLSGAIQAIEGLRVGAANKSLERTRGR
jgi:hypothetical protein